MQTRQKRAFISALVLSTTIMIILMHPANSSLNQLGQMNPGHDNLRCIACHLQEIGTLRQRLRANVMNLIDSRKPSFAIMNKPVTNKECMQCHQRDDDRHPTYRFNEPKYSRIRTIIAPQLCNSCHQEHRGQKVSSQQDICQHCHDELRIRKDPLEISHQTLIKQEQWNSCLGCHDFHGNHIRETPIKSADAISKHTIKKYFSDAGSPYSDKKHYKTKRIERYEKP